MTPLINLLKNLDLWKLNEGTVMNKAVLLFQYEERKCRRGVGARTMNEPGFGFSTDRKAHSSVRKVVCTCCMCVS